MREIGLTELAVNVKAGDTYFVSFPRLLAEHAIVRVRVGNSLNDPEMPVWGMMTQPDWQDVVIPWTPEFTGKQSLLLTREAEEPWPGDVRLEVCAAQGGMLATSWVFA
jgi:hypothetical protein